MSKTKKTNAMRILENNKISYKTLSYDVSDENFDGVVVSYKIGLSPSEVYKTLVTQGSGEYIVCVIPVNTQLDLKALAASAGIKKLELIPVNDIIKITGYLRGGCSPVGMKKVFPTFMDNAALSLETIAVSAGIRGTQLILSPKDLITLLGITLGDFGVVYE